MIKYLRSTSEVFRVLFSFWSTSIASELEYQLNLVIEIISVVANLTGSIFILSLFYSPTTNLGGWSWHASLVVLGIYTILDGYTTSFLHPNLSRIVRHVQNGTLDFVLLKPINSQLWLSFRIFSPWGIPSILSGITLVIIGFINSQANFSIKSLLLSILMVLSSFIILYSLWFLIATTSIWFVRVWNANEVLRSTLVAGRYPISAYPESLRRIFTFILPIAFLTTVPAEAILNILSYRIAFLSLILAIAFLFISKRFWMFALKFYTSASS